MQKTLIPACYFPSTVTFVGDDETFLTNITLNYREMLFSLYHSPQKALEELQSQRAYTECHHTETLMMSANISEHTFTPDLSIVHHEVYNPKRFTEIAIVVIDYSMHGMDGLTLCRALAHHPYKKILLTAKGAEDIALEAFNEGIIQRTIPKHHPDIVKLLQTNIRELQWDYFTEMSSVIVQFLSKHRPENLFDKHFATYFHQQCQQHQIVEFYLLRNSGSFILLDADANPYYLIVKTGEEVQRYCEIAATRHVAVEVLEQLRTGQKIPCFWNEEEDSSQGWSDWSGYLQDAEKIEGSRPYYVAFFQDLLATDIQRARILPYRHYLQQLNFKHVKSGSDAVIIT